MPVIAGATGVVQYTGSTGAPTGGTNAVQTLTFGAGITSGTYRLGAGGVPTAALAWNATNATLLATLQAALDAHQALGGTNGVVATAGTLTAGIGTVLLTFSGPTMERMPQPVISVHTNSLVTGTLTNATTTPGVERAHRDVAIGTLLQHLTDGTLYIKASSRAWVAIT